MACIVQLKRKFGGADQDETQHNLNDQVELYMT